MALILPVKWEGALFLSPFVPDKQKERENITMKIFNQLLFAVALVIGISITASAQENQKKTPPKENPPPVIFIEPKRDEKPKEDKPKDERNKDNKGKKPQAFFRNSSNGNEKSFT